MTNTIAFILAFILAVIFALDHFVFEWDLHVFLGKQLLDLVEIVAFWR